MAIEGKSFTALYDELEDRIRLIVNYKNLNERVDLLITRRFVLKMIPSLEEFLKNFKEESVTVNRGGAKVNSVDYSDILLYKNEKDLLLTGLNLTMLKNRTHAQMSLKTKDEKTEIKAVVNKKELEYFIDQIKKAIPNIQWSISANF